MSLPESLIILHSSFLLCLELSLYSGPSIITSTFTFKALTEGSQNVTKIRYMNVWRKQRILSSICIHCNLASKKSVTHVTFWLENYKEKKKQFATRTLYYFFQKNNCFNLQRSILLMCACECVSVCVCVIMVNFDLSRRPISFLIYQKVLNIYSKYKRSIIFRAEAVLFHCNLGISVLIVFSHFTVKWIHSNDGL